MSTSVLTTAQEWIKEIETQRKLNKEAKRAVISFAMWLDKLIDSEEKKEESNDGTKN